MMREMSTQENGLITGDSNMITILVFVLFILIIGSLEVMSSESDIAKMIRNFLYNKFKICFHNDATLKEDYNYNIPSLEHACKDLKCPFCGKKYIAQYYKGTIVRMTHVSEEIEALLERKYRHQERMEIDKRDSELREHKRKMEIERDFERQTAMEEKNTLDFLALKRRKEEALRKYKKYSKKPKD